MPDDLLDVLPTIRLLEDPSTSRDALLQLAQLVDNISGGAFELGEALRALGALIPWPRCSMPTISCCCAAR